MALSLKNLCKSAFNAANLNGLGAIGLSIGLGSSVGTGLFAGAVIWGTINKYYSLNDNRTSPASGVFGRLMYDPTITAKALMVAAGTNCGASLVDAALSDGSDSIQHTLNAMAWGAGVLGDNALRRLDKLNFTDHIDVKKGVSKVRDSFNAVVSNPVVFYNATAMCFSLSMLSGEGGGLVEKIVGGGTILGAASAISYAAYKAVNVVKNDLPVEDINDGVTNVISSVVPLGVGALGVLSGNYWVAGSQVIFGGSAIKSLYETRTALAKNDQISPL